MECKMRAHFIARVRADGYGQCQQMADDGFEMRQLLRLIGQVQHLEADQ